jgi:hypothetical protein
MTGLRGREAEALATPNTVINCAESVEVHGFFLFRKLVNVTALCWKMKMLSAREWDEDVGANCLL